MIQCYFKVPFTLYKMEAQQILSLLQQILKYVLWWLWLNFLCPVSFLFSIHVLESLCTVQVQKLMRSLKYKNQLIWWVTLSANCVFVRHSLSTLRPVTLKGVKFVTRKRAGSGDVRYSTSIMKGLLTGIINIVICTHDEYLYSKIFTGNDATLLQATDW